MVVLAPAVVKPLWWVVLVVAAGVRWMEQREHRGKDMLVAMESETHLHTILVLVAVVLVEQERREITQTVAMVE